MISRIALKFGTLLFVTTIVMGAASYGQEGLFVRGDVNGDGSCDSADASVVISYLYMGGATPSPLDAADVNDDGIIDISDVVCISAFEGGSGPDPAAPFPMPGLDPTMDELPHHLSVDLQAQAIERAYLAYDLVGGRGRDGLVAHAAQTIFTDLNGDGYRDLILRGAEEGVLETLLFSPNGSNHADSEFILEDDKRILGNDIHKTLAVDVDGDGVDELVLMRRQGLIDIHTMDTTGVSSSPLQSLPSGHELLDITHGSWGFAGFGPDSSSVTLLVRQASGVFNKVSASLALNPQEHPMSLVAQEHAGAGAGVLVMTNQNSVFHVDVVGTATDLTAQFSDAISVGDLYSAQAWATQVVGMNAGLRPHLIVRSFRGIMSGHLETMTSHGHLYVWDEVAEKFVFKSTTSMPTNGVNVAPLDINADGQTDLGYAVVDENSGLATWSAHLSTPQGFQSNPTVVGSLSSAILFATGDRIPMEYTPTAPIEVSQAGKARTLPSECLPIPVPLGSGATAEQFLLSEKICQLIDDMDELADKVENCGCTSAATKLREIAAQLRSLKNAGLLTLKDHGPFVRGRTNARTKAISIGVFFLGPDFDLVAACDPKKADYWKLMSVLLHEGSHSKYCVGHPEAQMIVLEILEALLEIPDLCPSTIQAILDTKATEKYYIMRTQGILRFAARYCSTVTDPVQRVLAMRNALRRLLALCGLTVPFSDIAGTTIPGPPPVIEVSYGGLVFRITCQPSTHPVTGRPFHETDLEWCGGTAEVPN